MYHVKKVVDGTIYCEKEKLVSKTRLMGKIVAIEQKTDKRNNPYFAIFILNAGEKTPLRWNFFNEKGKLFKENDLIIADGVFYSENKRLLRNIKKAK